MLCEALLWLIFARCLVPHMGMDQYLLIPFLVGWTSIYQLFWCSPGVQGFDTLPHSGVSTTSVTTGGVWFDCWEVTRSLLLTPSSNPQLPGENAAMCCDILILYSTQQCPEIEIFPNSSNSWLCLKIGYTAQMTSLCLKMMINTD